MYFIFMTQTLESTKTLASMLPHSNLVLKNIDTGQPFVTYVHQARKFPSYYKVLYVTHPRIEPASTAPAYKGVP